MYLRTAALAALLAACGVVDARADGELALDAAFARVEAFHPDLKIFRQTAAGLAAEADRAAQKPPLTLGAEFENAFGRGAAAGIGDAELSLNLSSVLERGDKRAARTALAQSRIAALDNTREIRRLDLLAEVARRYLDVVAAQALARIAELDREQRERTVDAATRRVRAGASPVSVQLAAQAQCSRAEIDVARIRREGQTAWRRLALLWGERDAAPQPLAVQAPALPAVPDFAAIAALLEATPDIARFADERRVREARVQLAQSETAADLNWSVGVRRLPGGDWGLLGGVSLPLGASSRAGPGRRSAQAELAALELERESGELSLYATLAETQARLASDVAEAAQLREVLLPRLLAAEQAAEQAYRAGALSYLEWAQLQAETTTARRRELELTVQAQRLLIELQRLTAQPFTDAAATRAAQDDHS
ncbi:MAG: hypothetical protein BGP24_06450 [Lysobacterales bacterium 69-70]|nr:TolC family protein [Xanthomonadaceae bacterium]ODU34985.1 MAG: hypothetical protein ABS97_07430 [Xanthomonadaceae bacterium SCN 69-320]ODV20248.1 MAG: hypothetical protein ABT27_08150 [Xanthomonadaceae bacterium SCN 69-25]OJY95240.1 MAG: hypothetical protein BGP24_06450 [Xanthomonadales bacterium 69-70]